MSQSNLAVEFDFEFPAKPKPLSIDEKAQYKARIKQLLLDKNAVLVAHYYTDPEIQALAEETGGCVADSLVLFQFCRHLVKVVQDVWFCFRWLQIKAHLLL